MTNNKQTKNNTLAVSNLHLVLSSTQSAVISSQRKLTALALGLSLAMVGLMPQLACAAVSVGTGSDWLQDGGGSQGIRYSELNQINTGNVSGLKQKYVLATYRSGSAMGAPLYVAAERKIYALTGSPNILMAWDVSKLPASVSGVAGSAVPIPPIWSSAAITSAPSVVSKGLPTSSNQVGANCCGGTNRGMAYGKAIVNGTLTGLIVYNLLDGHTVAVNASTGALVWNTKIANTGIGVTTSGQAVITGDNGQVILGTSSGEMGTRGYVGLLRPLESGERCMFAARVALGRMSHSESSSQLRPPQGFDSVASGSRTFVVFDNRSALPEYVVYFR